MIEWGGNKATEAPQGVIMNTMNTVIFFDSHGNPWATCSFSQEGAVAFGPTGAAIKAPGPTWLEAEAKGLIDRGEDGGFDILIAPSGLIEQIENLNRREDRCNDPEDHEDIAQERAALFARAGLWPARWAWETRLID